MSCRKINPFKSLSTYWEENKNSKRNAKQTLRSRYVVMELQVQIARLSLLKVHRVHSLLFILRLMCPFHIQRNREKTSPPKKKSLHENPSTRRLWKKA